MLRINLACGRERLKGYKGADLPFRRRDFPESKPDIEMDLLKKFPFEDSSVDSFRMKNFLIEYDETILEPVLKEIYRCLRPNGYFLAIDIKGVINLKLFKKYFLIEEKGFKDAIPWMKGVSRDKALLRYYVVKGRKEVTNDIHSKSTMLLLSDRY